MDEDNNIPTHSTPETISRQALGRIARLGDLYNTTTEKFCGVSIFRKPLPQFCSAISKIANPYSDISFTTVSRLNQNLQNLDVTGELKLSALAGMFEFEGSAKYLNRKKNSFKSVECTLVYNIKTVTEHLEIFDDQVKEHVSHEAAHCSRATHVVIGIQWGANCIVTVTDHNHEERDKNEIEGKLRLDVENIKQVVSPSDTMEVEREKHATGDWDHYKHEIFGDVLPDSAEEFPQTLDGALALMRRVPQLVQKFNDGKGKPLTYIMLPVSCLIATENHKQSFKGIGEIWTTKMTNVFEHVLELRQRAQDQIDKVNNHSYCVTASELEKTRHIEDGLEVQEAVAKTEFAHLLEKIRTEAKDVRCLDKFSAKHNEKSKELFCKCNNVYEAVQARIEFRKRCEKYGAKYLAPPVDQGIGSACDDYENVYVIFHGQADRETTMRNESAFIELAKANINDRRTVCYFTWSKENGEDLKIKHFRKGKLVQDDVEDQLETRNMAMCVPAARRAFGLVPFKVRCPGSYNGDCGREERTWTCINCNETLQICPYYRALYCHCGFSMVNRFWFRCHSDAHGMDFKQLRDDTLQKAIDHQFHHMSAAPEGNYLVKLFILNLWLSVRLVS